MGEVRRVEAILDDGRVDGLGVSGRLLDRSGMGGEWSGGWVVDRGRTKEREGPGALLISLPPLDVRSAKGGEKGKLA
jgi:hypothetical protein